ncbi:MAG: M28 family peptidase [Candidatus Nealsonbacteria bacterium]|nr:M28 family peptidase [Candidatus Nealsonbacteria bacterium]
MKRLVVCLAVIVSVSGVVLTSAPSSSAATTADLVGQVDPAQYEAYQLAVESMGLGLYDVSYNQGYRDRDGWAGDGSLGNQEARLYLTDQFTTFGLNVTIQGSYLNVVGELPGTASPNDVVIVCGHYDHIGGSLGNERPGGDDNASGTAGVLEAARVLSQYQFESTIRFIGFNAEEDGLWGSKDYVNNVVAPGSENVLGVINLDMILRPGSDKAPSEPLDLDLLTRNTTACTDWADTFITAAGTYVPSLSIDSLHAESSAYGSDHAPFANAGYPAFLAIENTASEIWGGANEYYHGPEDASDRAANDPGSLSGVTYDYDFATDVVAATVATVSQTATLVPEPGTLVMLLAGVAGLAVLGWRRQHRLG